MIKSGTVPTIFLIMLFTLSCNSSNKHDDQKNEERKGQQSNTSQVDLVKAKRLIQTCYVCHSPTAPENSRLAPPMEAVKRRYLDTFPNKETFVEKIAHFVTEPTDTAAIMFGAVSQFNLMTPVPFPEEDLTAIATYIYETELEYPTWFDEHYNERHGNGSGMGNGNGNGIRRQQRQGGNN